MAWKSDDDVERREQRAEDEIEGEVFEQFNEEEDHSSADSRKNQKSLISRIPPCILVTLLPPSSENTTPNKHGSNSIRRGIKQVLV